MKKEDLLKLGLSEEQASQVIERFGNMIPKSRFDEVINEKNELKEQLNQRDIQLKDLAKANKDNEELTSQIKKLQEENKAKTEEYQVQLQKLKLDTAIDIALTNSGSKNNRAIKALLNMETIKMDNDNLIGLDEQIKSLQESESYLFKSETIVPSGVTPKTATSANTDIFKPTSYEDFLKLELQGE